MDFNYEENEKILKLYIDDCRKKIENTFFSEDELIFGTSIKNDLIKKGEIGETTSVENAIKKHRNNMIDIKMNHTMRVVSSVSKMASKMNVDINFTKVVKIAALLHDIARFNQAAWSNSFNDKECRQFNGIYHAEFGYRLLYINKKIHNFKIPENYHFAISNAVRFHQIPVVKGDLALKINNISDLDVEKYLTGSKILNQQEKIIVATLVQMVKDVDMLDILYQHLTGEFPVIGDFVSFEVLNDSLDDISKYWEIDKEEIKKYNGLKSDDISSIKTIKIPSLNINPEKLVIPLDIQNKYFNNEDLDLKELQSRRDWTFITGMWWRLNHFLNNINFTSNLEVVEENKLLEKIYATYPDKYKPLVEPAFSYAKEYLLNKKIIDNKGNLYTRDIIK